MRITTKRTALALALSFLLAGVSVPAGAKNDDRQAKKGKAHQQQVDRREARPKTKQELKKAEQEAKRRQQAAVRAERGRDDDRDRARNNDRDRARIVREQRVAQERFEREQRRAVAARRTERLPAFRQQQLILEQQRRTAAYHQHLQRQEIQAQQRLVALERQRRAAQYRFHQQYLQRLHQQRLATQRIYDYNRDPYFYTAPSYRYARQGRYYEVNQYAAQLLQEAVNLGYQEGLRAGQADRQDRWGFDYGSSYAYQDANYGYDGRYIDQAEYNHYFREGFRRGYQDGHSSRMQYGYQQTGGTFGIIAQVLAEILQLQALR